MSVVYLPNVINIIIYKFVSFVLPTSDYMFFLDVSPEESLKRIDNRSEETEMFENMEELEKARIKSKKVTYDWNIINADNSIAKVNDEIKEKL
jgi:dTMP kinase